MKARIAEWIAREALPLWSGPGLDPATGGAWEALDAQGRPARGEIKRTRVQFRQIYAFSEAFRRGLMPDGLERARGLTRFCEAKIWSKGAGPGWIHRLRPDDSPQDSRRDAYDHVFAAFGFAALARAGGPEGTLWLARTLEALEGALSHPLGGWREDDRGTLPRRQNPHMHGLELFLALYESTGESRWLARADEMIRLFEAHFFDASRGRLLEYFTDDWRPLTAAEEQRLEPGHFMEWVWLLRRYQGFSGRDLGAAADALYAEGLRLGLDERTGTLIDETDLAGAPTKPTRRLWAQTELLKASLAQARAHPGSAAFKARAERTLDAIFGLYLSDCPSGGWRDQLDAEGRPVVGLMPASTLYHVLCAFWEAEEADAE